MSSRCSDREPTAELRHRLAAIYFSTPADRSIRNVADAMQFVNSTPAAITDKAERFDQLNALLQMLLSRWSARGEFRPTSSRVALNDIERSIAAAETSFATLDMLAAEGIVPAAEWSARKQYLERRLVRPLRLSRPSLAAIRQERADERGGREPAAIERVRRGSVTEARRSAPRQSALFPSQGTQITQVLAEKDRAPRRKPFLSNLVNFSKESGRSGR